MKLVPLLVAAALLVAAVVRRRRLTPTKLAAGAVILAGLLLYGTGVVQPPNLKDLIAGIGSTLGPYTYVFVGVAAFLETGAFVGLIAPGETTVIVGGVIAGQGEIDIVWLIAIVWACAVAGDTASFFLGRRLGREFLLAHGPRVRITRERLEHVERFFEHHGGKTILIGRFVGLVRAVAPFIAGASKMRYRRFAPYDILGAGLWGTTFCVLGYVFWQSFDQVADYAGKGAFALGTVILLVAGSVAGYRRLRHEQGRARARAWLHTQAQRPLLRPAARVLRPLVFSVAIPAWERARRPLRFTSERFTPGELGLELTSLVAIAAVGAFATVALALELGAATPYTLGDLRALELAGDVRSGPLDDVARAVAQLGSGPAVYVLVGLAAVVIAARGRAIEAAVLVAGLLATTIVLHVLKGAEERVRPAGALVETSSSSFPSGHAAYAVAWVAVAIALARAVPSAAGRVAVVGGAVLVAVAIGATRVYLRAHFVSDVVAGWGMAAAVFALCAIAGLVVAHLRQTSRS
ncbi:MAG: VTT domain-containing protein [Solirubrobacterales bacterium]|nr:VTT domain-containing protein [Solirubrobacterales bacterium]